MTLALKPFSLLKLWNTVGEAMPFAVRASQVAQIDSAPTIVGGVWLVYL